MVAQMISRLALPVALPFMLLTLACHDRSPAPTALGADVAAPASVPAPGTPVVLRGTILTPEGVIQHGYVVIADGRIVSVSDKQPDIPDAVRINTAGVILPGFVDLHNHVPWNVLPRWTPSRKFANQPEWSSDPEFAPFRTAFNHLAPYFCDMNAWGELRALVGGTTAMMATQQVACIHGLVRNLDYNSGFYGTVQLNREHVFSAGGFHLPPPSDTAGRAQFVQIARSLIENPRFEALALHVAEGTDTVAQEEFAFLESQALLNPKGILIHGISLRPSDFVTMAATGTALVWSPRSNLELYGATADIAAALDAGIEIALAPDWGVTGSSNMLDELKTAAAWNRDHLDGRLSNRQLVEMVSAVPAHVAGVDDEVGSVTAGLRADLVVIGEEDDDDDPYRSVIEATSTNVRLVLIDGVAVYGDPALMQRFWESPALEELAVGGQARALATSAAGLSVAQVAARLQAALVAEGRSLAPLTEGP